MKWSWKIGKIAGITVYVHATFFLLLLWFGIVDWTAKHSVAAVASGTGFVLAVFGCVVVHELGHALAAKRYGIRTDNITLLPIGGVSSLERMPEEPSQEFVVALTGPLVSVAIAALLFLFLRLTGMPGLKSPVESWMDAPFLVRLMVVNAMLAVFNLLPAFPMDGGRILRAFLAKYLGRPRATQIAAHVGQGIAFFFAIVGLFGNPILLLIAAFIWIGASQEAFMVQMKSALAGIPVSEVALTEFTPIVSTDSLNHVVELILHGAQQDFPVVEDGGLVGMLTRRDLLAGLAKTGPGTLVADAMRRNCPTVRGPETLQSALEQLEKSGCHALPIIQDGRLAGLFTADNLAEFLMIKAAVDKQRSLRRLPTVAR